MADPHAVIYGDRAYVYAGHDSPTATKTFVMKDWWIWSSADLVNWKQEGTLQPEDTFLKRPFNGCWAGFCVSQRNKYYWYFSAGPTEIGVVVADSPAGPWKDPLGKPLVAKGLTPTEQRDPDILIDSDGQAYMIYGTFKYFLVRLNDDMISMAEQPRAIRLDQEFGPYGAGKTDDKPSLHKRNGIYYLSWSSFYAMSTNVYGPYTYKGSVIEPEKVDPEFQVDKAVRKYDLWHDRHGNFFTWHNQWYYIVNDKSLPGRHSHFRDTCLSYVHYRDNGEMAPIRLDRIGVGQYDAAQPRIEAEDFFDMEKAEVKESPSGDFEIQAIKNNGHLYFPSVKNLSANATVTFSVSSASKSGGEIEIRKDDETGKLLGKCRVLPTASWEKYQPASCQLSNAAGTANLFLVFKGADGELFRLDWFNFTKPPKE